MLLPRKLTLRERKEVQGTWIGTGIFSLIERTEFLQVQGAMAAGCPTWSVSVLADSASSMASWCARRPAFSRVRRSILDFRLRVKSSNFSRRSCSAERLTYTGRSVFHLQAFCMKSHPTIMPV